MLYILNENTYELIPTFTIGKLVWEVDYKFTVFLQKKKSLINYLV